MKIAGYGWIRDLPDVRDRRLSLGYGVPTPPKVDLRPLMPPVYAQGSLGSCTGNAIAAAIEYELMRQNLPQFMPSRLFIYYNERVMEGTVPVDAGAQIRDGIKSVANQGACPENDWPYDVSKFAQQPPPAAYDAALFDRALDYASVPQDVSQLRSAMASGYPVVFGFSVYQSFESPTVTGTGVVPMPQPGETLLGGHAVLAVGYDDTAGRLIVRNSWGAGWGQGGYFTMPYEYLSLASDFWTIRLVGR